MIQVNIFVHSPLFCVLILYLFEIESQKWSAVVQGMHACWGGTYIGGFLPGHLCVGKLDVWVARIGFLRPSHSARLAETLLWDFLVSSIQWFLPQGPRALLVHKRGGR